MHDVNRHNGRLRLSVAARNFAAMPDLQTLRRVAEIGFETVDNFNWRDPKEFAAYTERLPRCHLSAGVLVVNKVPDVDAQGCSLVAPADHDGFLRELRLCMEAARQIACNRLEVLTGNILPGLSRWEQMENCVCILKRAVPSLESAGMTIVVEALNSSVDHPGYFLDRVQDGADIVRAVGSPRVKLLFDIYHVQIMEGNLIQRIRENIESIGQFHFADVPGRHEPGTGEINYRNVFRAINDLGYDGYLTAEYQPTDASLRDLAHVRELASFDHNSEAAA